MAVRLFVFLFVRSFARLFVNVCVRLFFCLHFFCLSWIVRFHVSVLSKQLHFQKKENVNFANSRGRQHWVQPISGITFNSTGTNKFNCTTNRGRVVRFPLVGATMLAVIPT